MDQNTQPTQSTSKKTGFAAQNADASEGTLQDRILTKIAELGDLLERAGEKIESKGFDKIGEAIYRLGDNLEHLKDTKFMSGKDKSSSTKPTTSNAAAGSSATDKPSKDQLI